MEDLNFHESQVGESFMIQAHSSGANGVKNRCVIGCSHGHFMHKNTSMKVKNDADALATG
jgi:hypothetical protein